MQAGYNVQFGQFVFGGETDLQVIRRQRHLRAVEILQSLVRHAARPRRLAMSSMLFYGTVGLAYGTLNMKNILTDVSESHTGVGWAGGAGVEVAVMGNWTARAEYLYVDLGSSSYVLDGTCTAFSSNVLRFGVNYRLRARR